MLAYRTALPGYPPYACVLYRALHSRFTLMAPDALSKERWASAIAAAVDEPAARLVLVEEARCK